MFDLKKVVVGPKTLSYLVEVEEKYPLYTSDDIESTNRVYQLIPEIADHVCVNENGKSFQDCMGHTETAHLLEHVTIELLARTARVSKAFGITKKSDEDPSGRSFETSLNCEDDTLTMAALSSAIWLMNWAFSGGRGATPNVEATTRGLSDLIDRIDHVPARR